MDKVMMIDWLTFRWAVRLTGQKSDLCCWLRRYGVVKQGSSLNMCIYIYIPCTKTTETLLRMLREIRERMGESVLAWNR